MSEKRVARGGEFGESKNSALWGFLAIWCNQDRNIVSASPR